MIRNQKEKRLLSDWSLQASTSEHEDVPLDILRANIIISYWNLRKEKIKES